VTRGVVRVLWLTENHPPSRGGMAQSSDRIVRGLRRAGVVVDVAHLTRAPVPWRTAPGEGGLLRTCPVDGDPEHALRRLWVDLDGDRRAGGAPITRVVAFGGTLPLLAAPVFAAWLGAPLVTLLRGNDFDTGVLSVRRRSIVLDALRSSRVVSVVASRNVPLVEALAPGVQTVFVPNGIDLADWEALPSERERALAWRRETVEPARRVVGLVGQLKRKKGVALFVDALARTGAAARVHLLLVGDVETEVVDALHACDALAWTHVPFLDRFELLARYPACDVVALPSFYDGLPNVALEAAALGIPLLTSDAGGLADLVMDGEHGIVFRAGDERSCSDAIGRLDRCPPNELASMGTRAAERVRTSFTAAAETDRYLELLAPER